MLYNGRTHYITRPELRCLDRLIGAALVDYDIHYQLIEERNVELMRSYGISEPTCEWLANLPVTTLTEMAQSIMSHT